jgi:tetratricopeptide (TPR) repeat protein
MKNEILWELVGEKEWRFNETKQLNKIVERLNNSEELKDDGFFDQAIDEFRAIIKKVPEYIEAYNDLYLCHNYLGNSFEAFAVLELATKRFLSLMPKTLFEKGQRLEWGWLENRPFLRLYANLGLEYLKINSVSEAKIIFDRLLSWNPNDNQGIRELALSCNLELGLLDDGIAICNCYPDDMLPGTLYGRSLILFMQNQKEAAQKALMQAIEYQPKVAKELIKTKHKPPKNIESGYVTMGGDDQAYLYWKDFGKFWEKESGAIKLLKNGLRNFNLL